MHKTVANAVSLAVCRAASGWWTPKGHPVPFLWHEGSPKVTDWNP